MTFISICYTLEGDIDSVCDPCLCLCVFYICGRMLLLKLLVLLLLLVLMFDVALTACCGVVGVSL